MSVFDDFPKDDVLSPRLLQDMQSTCLDIADKLKARAKAEKVDIVDDLVFEIELIKQVEVNIDYILELVMQARGGNGEDKVAYDKITRAIATSPQLRDKAELIMEFVERMGVTADGVSELDEGGEEARRAAIDTAWSEFVRKRMEFDLEAIIKEENLRHKETREVIKYAFDAGGVPETGTLVQRCLPRISRFSDGGMYGEKRYQVIEKLQSYYERYGKLLSWGYDN